MVGGAGHVGIPLVLALAEAGLRVNVNDLNQATLDTLQAGRLPFIEDGAEAVLAKALAGQAPGVHQRPDRISTGGPVIITIGTPIDEFLNPVRRVVQDCIDALLPPLADGQLVVLRSTVFPGTTDWLASYLEAQGPQAEGGVLSRARGAGLRAQGTARDAADRQRHARRRPNATRPSCSSASRRKWWWSSPIEAEFAKLFSNAYRYIEFAATNEFYLVAKSAGVDYQRVLDGDEAQLSALEEHAAAGLCRRPLPGQGHDAALGLRPQPVRPRPRRAA